MTDAVEWERLDRRSEGGIQVGVFEPPYGIHEKGARPAFWWRGRGRCIEFHGHLITRAHDHVPVVGRLKKSGHVTIARESARNRAPGLLTAYVLVIEPVWTVAAALAIHARKAAKMKIRRPALKFMYPHGTARHLGRDESLIPIDLHIRANTHVMISGRKYSIQIDDDGLVLAGREAKVRNRR